MDAEFYRRLAQQCRDLIAGCRTEVARSQLSIWIEEFDAQADAVERELEIPLTPA